MLNLAPKVLFLSAYNTTCKAKSYALFSIIVFSPEIAIIIYYYILGCHMMMA